jgi:hypothetical protein
MNAWTDFGLTPFILSVRSRGKLILAREPGILAMFFWMPAGGGSGTNQIQLTTDNSL